MLFVERPDRLQRGRLQPVPNAGLRSVPAGVAPFLQRGVVQVTVRSQAGRHGGGLARCGPQLELEGPPHAFRHGRSYWVSMYFCTVLALTAPTVATKNDRDHRVGRRDRR
jgi:hypothetical protein